MSLPITKQPYAAQPARRFSLFKELKKWGRVYSVFFQDAVVYKANAVIWLMTDTVPAVIMPLVWLASYNGRATIGGFNPSQMVVYYMVILFLSCAVESHILWDIASEVKEGKFNVSLTRPFSYMAYQYAGNISWRLMRTLIFVPLFLIVLAMFGRWVHWDARQYDFGWHFWLALILGHFVSFMITYAMGLLSLYFVEARSIFNFYYLPLILFNGQIAPLAFFPPAVAKAALVLPWAYTLSFPAQIFIRQMSPAHLWLGFGMQVFWMAAGFGASVLLWRGGLKRYTAYGI